MCKELSLWASNGEHDDWYWRTAGSGGRAKTRARSGKRTIGSYGDIKAECGKAEFLLEHCSLELKNGYGSWSFLDCLDKAKTKKHEVLQHFEKFLQQAKEDACNAKVPYSIIIAKRDKRRKIVILPMKLFKILCPQWEHKKIVFDSSKEDCLVPAKVVCVLYDDFFSKVTPNHFKELL